MYQVKLSVNIIIKSKEIKKYIIYLNDEYSSLSKVGTNYAQMKCINNTNKGGRIS